jgi:tRNA(Ile)-lysidine synthase
MKKTEQTVIEYISRKGLITEKDKVLVAFSGGADSVFLLSFLLKFRRKYKIEVAAYHLNHMLRKKAAFNDEEFCRLFCEGKKIPFFSGRVDVKTTAAEEGISVEEAGRNIRYKLLNETAVQEGFTKIATGHNRDDNTETVMLNLFKGTGIRGISGIPSLRGNIIRPLLNTSKDDIREYLTRYGIKYLTDKTNLRNDYERNFIRNRIIPELKKRINPSLDEAIMRSSEVFRNISSYVDKKALEAEEGLAEYGKELRLKLDKLPEEEIQPVVLKKIIERNFLTELSFNDILSVLSLKNKTSGKGVSIPGKIRAVREREYLIIYNEQTQSETRLMIKTGGHCEIEGKTLFIEQWSGRTNLTDRRSIEYISGDELGDNFFIREWRNGDKFTPLGMSGSVKVSDYLNSLKVPSFEKKKKLLLTDGKDIIWIIGYRISEKFKVKPDTKRVLKLCLK